MDMRSITVRGTAKLLVSPDFAEVLIDIKEENKNFQAAQTQLKNLTAEIMACAQLAGLSKDCIKTSNYSAQMKKRLDKDWKGNQRIVDDGCICSQTVSVGFPADPTVLGELVNTISTRLNEPNIYIRFSIKDRNRFDAELLKKITEDAQTKAAILCAPSGAKIGKLLSVDYHGLDNSRFNFSSQRLPNPVGYPAVTAPPASTCIRRTDKPDMP